MGKRGGVEVREMRCDIDVRVGGEIEVGYRVEVVWLGLRWFMRPRVAMRVTYPDGSFVLRELGVGDAMTMSYRFFINSLIPDGRVDDDKGICKQDDVDA